MEEKVKKDTLLESQPLNKTLLEPAEESKHISIEMESDDQNSIEFEPPKSHQFRALFFKAVVMQLRQKANTLIQVLAFSGVSNRLSTRRKTKP